MFFKPINNALILLGIFTSALGYTADSTNVFSGSLGKNGRQKIWSITSPQFSEVRYDSDGDGKINQWLLTKGNLKVDIRFDQEKIQTIKFIRRNLSQYTEANYELRENALSLVNIRNMERSEVNMVRSFGSPDPICSSNLLNDPLPEKQIANINGHLLNSDQELRWAAAIDKTCKPAEAPVRKALKTAFTLDRLEGTQSNVFLACLANNSETVRLVSNFTDMLQNGPSPNSFLKITCSANHDSDCGKASYSNVSSEVNLSISTPGCSTDMAKVYRQQLFHEALHSIDPTLQEESIVNVVDFCENPKPGKVLKSLKIDRNTSPTNVIIPTEQKQTGIAKAAQSQLTNIPKSLAEGSLAIPAPEPQTPGMVALNNSFQETRGPASASVTIPLQQSLAMSAPFFKAAAKVFSNYKLEPMQGSAPISTQLATQKAPRVNTATVVAGSSGPVRNLSANAQGSPREVESTVAAAENAEPTPSPAPTANQAPTGARSSEVGSGGARGIASAPSTNNSTSVAVKPRVSNDASIDQERAKVAQNLVKMSISQAREYIKSNEGNLERLKILILSQKNQRWGYKDPSRAAVLIQEVNGQLRIESQ